MEKEAKMICPYCNIEFTPEMRTQYSVGSSGCDTCGYGAYGYIKIEIYCGSCGKLIYVKEGRTDDD